MTLLMTIYDPLCQWTKETETVIKCRKPSENTTLPALQKNSVNLSSELPGNFPIKKRRGFEFLFVVSVSQEIKYEKSSNISEKFRCIIRDEQTKIIRGLFILHLFRPKKISQNFVTFFWQLSGTPVRVFQSRYTIAKVYRLMFFMCRRVSHYTPQRAP